MTYKQKRLKLVWDIQQQLKKCDCKEYNADCINCSLIKKLGLELEEVTNENRTARGVEVLKPKPANVLFIMDVSEYHKYKEQNMLDKDIAKLRKISKDTLTRWKRENGLIEAKK